MKLRLIIIIAWGFFLTSCGSDKSNNQSTEGQLAEDTLMEANLIIKDSVLDSKPISEYLSHPDLDPKVADYLTGKFTPENNQETKALLDTLLNNKGPLRSLYFRAFNQICKDSNDDLSALLSDYSVRMLEENTGYCVGELKKGAPDYFTGFVSNKLYLEPDWKSEFDRMSKTLYGNLGAEDTTLTGELDHLMEGILNDIEHLQEEDHSEKLNQ